MITMNELQLIDTDDIRNELVNTMTEAAWNRIQAETKVDLVTAELCYRQFLVHSNTGLDFSSVINPVMKALELELRTRFYDEYFSYIKRSYSPSEYAHTVWKKNYPGDSTLARVRCKILEYAGNSLIFQTDTDEFTIGNFRFTIGATSLKTVFVDQPVIDFCQKELFREYQVSASDIQSWLKSLVLNIESMRELRNDSSHAGKTQSQADAETALDELVKVKKIIATIVCPPWVTA